jgi:hypothetical protein
MHTGLRLVLVTALVDRLDADRAVVIARGAAGMGLRVLALP